MIFELASKGSDTDNFTILGIKFFDAGNGFFKVSVIGEDNSLFSVMFEIFAFDEVDEEEGGKRNGEVDGEKSTEKEAGDTVANVSHVNDGGENNCHEDVGESGGFEVAKNTTSGSDGVIAIKGKNDEIREKQIEEDGGVFEVTEGNIGRVPAETREVGN